MTQHKRRPGWLLLLGIGLVGSFGCGGNFRLPNLFHPGPTGPQRYDAVYHDPYPIDDLGPAVEGGRPREYQRAVPQVTRGRLFRPPPSGYGY